METENQRRKFIKTTATLGVFSLAGLSLLTGCNEKEDEGDEGQKVSPPEDLMQEHGLLNRILLIYDFNSTQLIAKQDIQREALYDAAEIVRVFVEDYHEKQEEDYLFPRFEKVNQLTDLVKTLRAQHKAGRIITDRIMRLCKAKTLSDNENQKLLQLITAFNTMYRPHEAREDTILFPAFRKIVSKNEYDSLGEEFENNEHKLFGKGGFESMVEKVAIIEKKLGIYELSQFSPKL
jgi:hemerythrin-like domain-containing protein